MTATRASTGMRVLAACLPLWGALSSSGAHGQDAGPGVAQSVPAGTTHFDLPAQPLADAIEAYGRMTELSVLVGSSLLAGRMSAPVQGDYSPREALRRLLAGTGLQASFTSADAAVVVLAPPSQALSIPLPSEPASAPPIAGVMAGGSDNRAYAAMIQARLAEVLCDSPQTRPGSFRLVVQLRIDGSGAVSASHVVGSTGTPERDAAIVYAIRAMVFDSAPPAALEQPVTILFRSSNDGMSGDCLPTDERGS